MVHYSGKIEGSSGRDLAHLLRTALLQGEGGIHLLSSRHTSPPPGTVPLWVSSRLNMVHFSRKNEGGCGCDLVHLLGVALLQGGLRYGPAIFRGDCPHHGVGPL